MTAQDWVRTGTNLESHPIRMAAADFKPVGSDPQMPVLKNVFDSTLFGDLSNAGIFDMVSKSLAPQATPGSPQELTAAQWTAPPASAGMVALGAFSADNGRLAVYGWLMDVTTAGSPPVLTRQYNEAASEDMARTLAHRFADDIIARLGGGVNGIAETKIYFVSNRTGSKEIWVMDYDGSNQHAVTHLGTVSISPRISPDGSRIAFSSLAEGSGWAIRMFSLDVGRTVSFPAGTAGGSNLSPAWSADGEKIAFSSARSGHPEIWAADAGGGKLHQITTFGSDVSPVWNPRTGAQLAFVSGRTGEPQIYVMDQDGSNVQRMTDSGYAISPSWSSSGLLAFSWNRKYGPGDPGGQDIYVMDIASKRWLQATHEAGSNDFPSWSPDGRHIVFQREINHHTQIWSMLGDGTEQHQLTFSGENSMPNWSWK
jgi:TolB protein